jgi:hypothetical protein
MVPDSLRVDNYLVFVCDFLNAFFDTNIYADYAL